MQDDVFLTTEEAAAYLRLKERKLYELVAHAAIPCSKVTGKWLFPRAALDRWVSAGLARPDGFVAEPVPPIIGGSHDPLLEWAARQSGSGLALLAEGSEAGLDRLERNEVAAAALHLHGQDGDDRANLEGVAARAGLHDAVVIGFVRREQGFVVAAGNPLGIGSLDDVARAAPRIGLRPRGAARATAAGGAPRPYGPPGRQPPAGSRYLSDRTGPRPCRPEWGYRLRHRHAGRCRDARARLRSPRLGALRHRPASPQLFRAPRAEAHHVHAQPCLCAARRGAGGYDLAETGIVRLNDDDGAHRPI